MSIDQALSERRPGLPYWKKRGSKKPKHIAPQFELGFQNEPFRLVGDVLPIERAEPTKAAELFAQMRASLSQQETPNLL